MKDQPLVNWIHPTVNQLVITRDLLRFRDVHDLDEFDSVIAFWKEADESRDNPRELIRLFGEGLALFRNLPSYIKDAELSGTSVYGQWIFNAMLEALAIAEQNEIAVTLSVGGAIFH